MGLIEQPSSINIAQCAWLTRKWHGLWNSLAVAWLFHSLCHWVFWAIDTRTGPRFSKRYPYKIFRLVSFISLARNDKTFCLVYFSTNNFFGTGNRWCHVELYWYVSNHLMFNDQRSMWYVCYIPYKILPFNKNGKKTLWCLSFFELQRNDRACHAVVIVSTVIQIPTPTHPHTPHPHPHPHTCDRFYFIFIFFFFYKTHEHVLWNCSDMRASSQEHLWREVTLVQVMAWCCHAKSHYLSQYWARCILLYGITKPHVIQERVSGWCFQWWSPGWHALFGVGVCQWWG